MDTLELFPNLTPSLRANGDGCSKPIGNPRAGRRRRAATPRKSPLARQLAELRRLVENRLDAIMVELQALRQHRRDDGKIPAVMLRRVSQIERHLRLVESPAMPRVTRRRPLDG